LKADGTVDTNTYSTATGVANNADVTPSWVPATDPGYATTDYVDQELTGLASESWANTNLVNVSGDTMTGDLIVPNLRSDEETSGTIANNNWYRVLEINGPSGRGKCEFILESNGGSGTPFSLRGAISTTWSAGDQTLTIHHNSLGSINEMRVVRNSAGNRNYLDIKSSGEDFITFTILPHKKVGAEAVDFTDVTTLPSGDTVQDAVAIQGKTIVSQVGNYSAFTVDKDSSVTVKDVIASGNIGINTTSPATKLNIDLGSGGTNGVAGLRIGATSNYASLELGTYGAYGGMVRSYGNDLHYFSGHWRTIGTNATENHSHYWYTSKSGSSDWSVVKMELDHNGNLGIGTTSPNSRLEVAGETKTTSLLISDSASGLLKGHGDAYHGIMFRGTPSGATTYGITAGDQISFYEYGGEFRFYQKNNVGGGVLNEVARIHHSNSFFNSNVGIGTTSPGYKLDVAGTIRSGTAYRTSISADSSGAVVLFGSASDNDSLGVVGAYASLFNISSGNGDISFQFNNTERMRLNSTGNLGIGTTSPGGRLELNGSGQSWTTAPAIRMWDSFNSKGWLVGSANNVTAGDFYIRTLPSEDANPGTGNTEFTIKHSTGNVGIGITSPGAKLDVRANAPSTSGSIIYVRNTLADGTNNTFGGISFFSSPGTDYTIGKLNTGSASALAFRNANNGTEYMRIASTGDVGIGTTSPGHKLEVNGVIQGFGAVRVNSTSTGSPYFGLYQNGSEKAFIQYADTGDNLVVQSDGKVTIRGDVQYGQGEEYGVISFNQSTAEIAKIDQDGYMYAAGFKTTTAATGFLKADGSVDTSTYASSTHNHDSDYVAITGGYYDSDFSWDGTHDFMDEIKVSGASATTTNTTALFYGTGGLVEKRALGTAAFSATGDFAAASHTHSYLPLAGGTLTGDLLINTGTNGSTTQAYSAFDSLQFNNQYNSVAAGPNKIVMYDDGGSWVGGFGIHDDTTAYYSGGTHKWYKTATGPGGPTFTQKMSLDSSGNLVTTGTLSASGYNDSNWNTAHTYSQVGHLPLAGGTLTGGLTGTTASFNSGAAYPLRTSSGQRYGIQVRNTANTVNANYGWWWFMDTNFNMGFHADGAADRFTLTRDGDLTITGDFSSDRVSVTGSLTEEAAIHINNGRLRIGHHNSGGGVWFDTSSANQYWFAGLDGNSFRIWRQGNRLEIANDGTLKLNSYGAGLLKTNSTGQVSLDTNTYLTSYTETDTLATVTGRGASTTAALSVRNVTARNIVPESDRTYDLGAEETRWRVVYCETLDSAGQHESNLQDQEQPISQYKTGTVLSWKSGKNRPCTQFADHMRMGIAVEGQDSPLIQGAEPVLVTGVVEEGDYLVTSEKEGHAVAVPRNIVKEQMLFDCVIGKALESGDGDSHLIKTWINI